MIQRIQTVYMLAAVVAILMMLIGNLTTFLIPEVATFSLTSLGISSLTETIQLDEMAWDLFLVLLIMMVLPLVNIFLYKKQKLQIRILIYTAVLDLLFYALFFWKCSTYAGQIEALQQGAVTTQYNYLLLIMPALSVFCCVMAIRGVIFDIALLKSYERLR